MQKKTYEVQGMTFRLKPTTRNNVMALMELDETMQEEESFKSMLNLFTLLTEPLTESDDHAKIDADDFDVKLAEEVVVDFMPTLGPTFGALIGSTLA